MSTQSPTYETVKSSTIAVTNASGSTNKIIKVLHLINGEHFSGAERVQDLLDRSQLSLIDHFGTVDRHHALSGVGPRRRKQLLRRFGSVTGVEQATVEELRETLGPKLGQQVFEQLAESAANAEPS